MRPIGRERAVLASMDARVWARDANLRQSLEDYVSRPTVTIEGLVGGYTGPGGKTVLPTKMTAKMDMRLVAGLGVHRRSAAASRRALRTRLWRRRARAGRVLPDRVDEPEMARDGRLRAVLRRLPVRRGLNWDSPAHGESEMTGYNPCS